MKKILSWIVLIIAIIVFGWSSFLLFSRVKEKKENDDSLQIIRKVAYNGEITEKEKEEYEETGFSDERISRFLNLKDLYDQNNDFIGWVQIEDTQIDYPVVQNKDNPNYYLKRNFQKQSSSYGCIYMDAACTIGKSRNYILYGHHMKNGSMFASLEKYTDISYYRQHSIVQFDTLTEMHNYEIIGAFKIKQSEIDGLQKICLLNTMEQYNDFVEFFESHKFYDTGVEYSAEDHFLTLMTCEYTNTNGRFFIWAKEIR